LKKRGKQKNDESQVVLELIYLLRKKIAPWGTDDGNISGRAKTRKRV